MPSGPRAVVAPTWAIRSVTVRTRDSAERLDQVYRRLIDDSPRDQPQPAPHARPSAASPEVPPELRR